jgi:hypothetical protein
MRAIRLVLMTATAASRTSGSSWTGWWPASAAFGASSWARAWEWRTASQ